MAAVDPQPAGARATATRLVLALPHRFFFLAGVVSLALVSLWWLWVQASRALPMLPPPAAAVPDTTVHALLMLCGFAPLFMFGFLFTAGPRWLGVPPPEAARWRPPGALAAAAAIALVPLQIAGSPEALRVAAGAYALGWLWLVALFLALIRASDAADKVHAKLVLIALVIGASAPAAFALTGVSAHAWVKLAGLWGFLLPVFVTVCHRMIPFFTANVVPFVTAFRPWWLLAAMALAPLVHGLFEYSGLGHLSFAVDLPVAALMLWLTLRWGLVQSMTNRLLAMLHIGFVWYGIGFLALGADSLAVRFGADGYSVAALHALTIGFASSLLMAMVTRATYGHSGRMLAADRLTWRLFLVLQAAAGARVAAAFVPGWTPMAVAALLWTLSFAPWCVRSAPVYWQPRIDGRPG